MTHQRLQKQQQQEEEEQEQQLQQQQKQPKQACTQVENERQQLQQKVQAQMRGKRKYNTESTAVVGRRDNKTITITMEHQQRRRQGQRGGGYCCRVAVRMVVMMIGITWLIWMIRRSFTYIYFGLDGLATTMDNNHKYYKNNSLKSDLVHHHGGSNRAIVVLEDVVVHPNHEDHDDIDDVVVDELSKSSLSLSLSLSSCLEQLENAKLGVSEQKECLWMVAKSIARLFPLKTYTTTPWCIPEQQQRQHNRHDHNGKKGIILVKVPKSASSTSAGIALRIGNRYNCSIVHYGHQPGYTFFNGERGRGILRNESFVLTTVRDPAKRAISTLYFHKISRRGIQLRPTILPNTTSNTTMTTNNNIQPPVDDAYILNHLQLQVQQQQQQDNHHEHYGTISEGQGGFTLRYTSFQSIPKYSAWDTNHQRIQNISQIIQNVKMVLQNYDFLLLVERMDESLVALSFIMGIQLGDVLVTSSKVSGNYQTTTTTTTRQDVGEDHTNHHNRYYYHYIRLKRYPYGRCIPSIRNYHVSPTIKQYLYHGYDWYAQNIGDYLLHIATNLSLDYTIDHIIGRERFNAAYQQFQWLRKQEQTICAPHVQFPCSNTGQPQTNLSKQNCYIPHHDFGCGYKCIDHLLTNVVVDDNNNNNNNNAKNKQKQNNK